MAQVLKGIFLGVDVGSGSVRVVALGEKGELLSNAVENLEINRPRQDYHEQSTAQIWNAICKAARRVISDIGIDKAGQIKSVGFDATCSLVVLDAHGQPLSVTPSDAKSDSRIWDVIMWLDHRAIDQADRINSTKHDRLKYAGGQLSPEMEPPKLLWLKEKKPEIWKNVGHVMDLADFLTYKATGSLIRSQCTTVGKWMYDASAPGGRWDASFWNAIGTSFPYFLQYFMLHISGLQEFANSSAAIGSEIRPPGYFCGCLSPEVVSQFGLPPSCADIRVAVGIIDAHAGVIGSLGASTAQDPTLAGKDLEEKLSIISGTSACHMATSREPHFVKGVWGPNYGVIFDGLWLNEAGQSALGPILDEVAMEGNYNDGLNLSEKHKNLIDELLNYEKTYGVLAADSLTKDLHVWPDYHGNRSPLADPNCKAVIAGLRLKSDIDSKEISSTAVKYLAHIQALAYMTRFIMETIAEYSGPKRKPFSVIYLCGGLQKNSIYVQTHADVCQMPVVVPSDLEVVARGAAILGANASGQCNSLKDAMDALSCAGKIINPRKETSDFHKKKYEAFRLLGKTELEIRRIMASGDTH